jgi:hypothetical protein
LERRDASLAAFVFNAAEAAIYHQSKRLKEIPARREISN